MPPPGLPPRLPTRLLEMALPRSRASDAVVGDLHEEFLARATRGPWRARIWYWRQALTIAARYTARSVTWEGRRDRLGPGGGATWEGLMDRLVFNIRYSVRRLLRSPGFTLVAILSLGLGIGANTAMFTIVNAVAIRELPFEEPQTLVNVYGQAIGDGLGSLSYPDYEDLAEGTRDVFEGVSATAFTFIQTEGEDGGLDLLWGEAVTGNYFEVSGVRPYLGRLIGTADQTAPGADAVVVLGYEFWKRRFASDPQVIGSAIRLAGRPYTVIGVAPESFTGRLRGVVSDAYLPITMYDQILGSPTGESAIMMETRGNHSLFGMARLRAGVTLAQAQEVALRVADDLRARYPLEWTADNTFALVHTEDVIMNPTLDTVVAPAGVALMVIVGLVLLIACANLAGFLLATAVDRKKEIAVRLAIGASRRTLVGQLLTETLILSGCGGLLGIVLSVQSLRALIAADLTGPLGVPLTIDLSPDPVVLAFTLLVTLAAGVFFGLAPALQGTKPDLAPTLRDETTGGGGGRSTRLRSALVLAQVSASVILLVGAGLLSRSLDAARRVDPGFGDAPTGILQLFAQSGRYSAEEAAIYFDELEDRMAEIPGVESVGYTTLIPLNQTGTNSSRVVVDGIDPPPGQDYYSIDRAAIDDGFLEAAGIEVVSGRGFDASDAAEGEPVALVNRQFERQFFAGSDALGRTIRVDDVETRIVGVIEDIKVHRLAEAPVPYLLVTRRQAFSPYVTFLARGTGDAEAIAHGMLAAARDLDPDILVFLSSTMERHLGLPLLLRRIGAYLIGGFAVLALLLASMGLYGMVSYAVARRAREVGIRMSLGADAGRVAWMLTRKGMTLVVIGAVVGLAVSAVLARLVAGLLYGVPALDPITFLGVPAVLVVVALAASWFPARKVTRLGPLGALRSE